MLKLKDVKTGDILIPDKSFTCAVPGSPKIIHMKLVDDREKLFFYCGHGKHFLETCEDADGNLVGLTRAPRHE